METRRRPRIQTNLATWVRINNWISLNIIPPVQRQGLVVIPTPRIAVDEAPLPCIKISRPQKRQPCDIPHLPGELVHTDSAPRARQYVPIWRVALGEGDSARGVGQLAHRPQNIPKVILPPAGLQLANPLHTIKVAFAPSWST